LKRKVITTADGSKTIQIEEWNEQYHSVHGAIQEAKHVFIKHGLHHLDLPKINIVEFGFGTGLNALLTLIEAEKLKMKVRYTGLEAYPVAKEEIADLNYIEMLGAAVFQSQYEAMHLCDWNKPKTISSHFVLEKQLRRFENFQATNLFNLAYFDAFGARVQPSLWTTTIFQSVYQAMKKNGVLVTYAAKGSVRRAMQEVGFDVERLPGPPGKREMLRATKKI